MTAPDAAEPAETAGSEYNISASTSFQERQSHTLKDGDSFAVFDRFGDMVASDGNPEGIYHRDTRHLSRMELSLFDQRLILLSSVVQEDNGALVVDLANPGLSRGDRLLLPRDTVHVHRLKFLWQSAVYERISVFNYDDRPHGVRFGLRFGADFADLFEARGQRRPKRGQTSETKLSATEVKLGYVAVDGRPSGTLVRFWPPPTQLDADRAEYEITLEPHQRVTVFVQTVCGDTADSPWDGLAFLTAMGKARRARRRLSARAASIETSSSLFNEIARRSVADLYMLMTETEHGPFPYAGTPWFSTPFGRDSIITALFMLWADPTIAQGVLRFLAATQARDFDAFQDAEPGKIIHEVRGGEMARLREVPFGLYYGAVDSTPLFVLLAGEYERRTGDMETIRRLWPNIEAALAWMDTHGDPDGDGFVEYHRKRESGLANQGWKDSSDSISHADGSLATGPIALCEVQGYVYAARQHAARLARRLGKTDLAAKLDREAERLRLRFEAAFWCDEIGSYAMALDGAKQPCRVISSNAGHALFCGIASPERARLVADTLLAPSSFSGWGVRTLATSERRYNPMSYHNGSVWPHDNGLIALGFARYNLKRGVQRIARGLIDAASYDALRRLPELFCGFGRKRRRGPTSYPVACAPQAWAAATPLALVQASLGLLLDHTGNEIRLEKPALPDILNELLLRNLRLGSASADLHLRSHNADVAVDIVRRSGSARIVTVH